MQRVSVSELGDGTDGSEFQLCNDCGQVAHAFVPVTKNTAGKLTVGLKSH